MSEPIDVSVAQDGGIMKTILQAAPEGALGPPPNGTEVTAHYTGELTLLLFHCISSCFLSEKGLLLLFKLD